MLLKPVSDGPVTAAGVSTGTLTFESGILGAVDITADGSNVATVTLQQNNSSGKVVFSMKTKQPISINGPRAIGVQAAYYSVTGTAAEAMFYEWVE